MKKNRYLLCLTFLIFGGCYEGDNNTSEKLDKTQILTDQSRALEQAKQVEKLIQSKDAERRLIIDQQRQ